MSWQLACQGGWESDGRRAIRLCACADGVNLTDAILEPPPPRRHSSGASRGRARGRPLGVLRGARPQDAGDRRERHARLVAHAPQLVLLRLAIPAATHRGAGHSAGRWGDISPGLAPVQHPPTDRRWSRAERASDDWRGRRPPSDRGPPRRLPRVRGRHSGDGGLQGCRPFPHDRADVRDRRAGHRAGETAPGRGRQALASLGGTDAETRLKRAGRYGGSRARRAGQPAPHPPFFGLTLVACERGDIRQSPDGLSIYGNGGIEPVPLATDETGRDGVVRELYDAVHGRPSTHGGRWGKATLEVCLAVLASARERREVFLSHQTPTEPRLGIDSRTGQGRPPLLSP